jgi:hypothetical protein
MLIQIHCDKNFSDIPTAATITHPTSRGRSVMQTRNNQTLTKVFYILDSFDTNVSFLWAVLKIKQK